MKEINILTHILKIIANGNCQQNRWMELIDEIKGFFDADIAHIAVNKKLFNNFYFQSKNRCFEIGNFIDGSVGSAKEIIETSKALNIKDYQNYKLSTILFKQMGIQTLLGCPITFQGKTQAALEVARFRANYFNEEELTTLEMIAKCISFVFDNIMMHENFRNLSYTRSKEIDFFIAEDETQKDLSTYIGMKLDKILKWFNFDIVSFSMPFENVYAFIKRYSEKHNFISFSRDKHIESMRSYRMCIELKKNIEILEPYNTKVKEVVDLSHLDIRKAIFVPIVLNDITLATFMYGFNEDIEIKESILNTVKFISHALLLKIITLRNTRIRRFDFEVNSIMKHVESKIFGQNHILNQIEDMIKVIKAGITENDKPLYVALLLGPTGVGKTELVKVISEAIYGDKEHFSRIDMNTLSQEHYAASLTGSPPGYVGSKENISMFVKTIIEGSDTKPGIVLFDEIEKASKNVLQTLLNVFDNGIMQFASGEGYISFRNSIIFMTSNIGAEKIFNIAESDYVSSKKQLFDVDNYNVLRTLISKELENYLSPEFINRIDDILIFNWLNQDALFDILNLSVENLNNKLKKYNAVVKLDTTAKSFLIEKGFNKQFGARTLKRAIRKFIEIPIASALLDTHYNSSIIFQLTKGNDILHIETHE